MHTYIHDTHKAILIDMRFYTQSVHGVMALIVEVGGTLLSPNHIENIPTI
jgi:hypothetical protein